MLDSTTSDETLTMMDWALAYAAQGFVVLPLNPYTNREKCKEPHWMLGSGFHYCATCKPDGLPEIGSTDPDAIRRWWIKDPMANIGIVTGARSRLLDLDVDMHSGDGRAEFARWKYERQCEGKILPDHPTYDSATGGVHHLFYIPEGLHLPSNLKWLQNAEVKSCNGYVVAPPSMRYVEQHIDDGEGGFYVDDILARYAFTHTINYTEIPEWLIEDTQTRHDKLKRSNSGAWTNLGRSESQLPTTEFLLEHGFAVNDRDNECHALACRLWQRHWPQENVVTEVIHAVWDVTLQPSGQKPFTWSDAQDKIRVARVFISGSVERQRAVAERLQGQQGRRGRRDQRRQS